MKKKISFEKLEEKIVDIISSKADKSEKLKSICELLKEKVPYYNWVGFYFVSKKRKRMLELGPYVGEPTEHTLIPFGKGICGQTAESKKTFVVQDVRKEKNYLACSINVKSEIVVPIFKNRKFVGVLDIDSHILSPFDDFDKTFLEKVCKLVAEIL